MNKQDYIDSARDVINQEIKGLEQMIKALGEDFIRAVDIMHAASGRVIISGMGKSGHIARKMAATFASTGTPAFFVHPAEASHGDLGMITKEDVVMLLSNSGETSELSDMIAYCKRFNIPLIAIVRRPTSVLVKESDIAFILPEVAEASPVNAPTTSTTMMLAWGDALAITLLHKRGFDKNDFHTFHPGGKLGANLLKVNDLMKQGEELPLIAPADVMSDVLIVMTQKSLGCAAVVENGKPVGVITDGDLRRHMGNSLVQMQAKDVMKAHPITIAPELLCVEALAIMNDKKITSLFVEKDNALVGILHIHDILRAGVS